MNWTEQLPVELQPFLERFQATAIPCIRLEFENEPPAKRWSSALGRILYWPAAQDWPTDENGRPLFGLLQLNLAELPAHPNLPQHGIVQFFITDNAFWGANPLDPRRQDNFRLIYHDTPQPEATELLSDFSFLPAYEDLPLPQDVSLAISGTLVEMPMPPQDYRFEETLGDIFSSFEDQRWELLGAYKKAIGTVGHRLGGYASFVQDDPRHDNDETNWELLLQLDTDPQAGLIWGDYGVAHWFYAPTVQSRSLSEIPAHPFDAIWYGWECG